MNFLFKIFGLFDVRIERLLRFGLFFIMLFDLFVIEIDIFEPVEVVVDTDGDEISIDIIGIFQEDNHLVVCPVNFLDEVGQRVPLFSTFTDLAADVVPVLTTLQQNIQNLKNYTKKVKIT